MEFKALFRILKKHLANGDGVLSFFRELMAMITTVTEEEWGTSKDPGQKLSDETIRTYTKKRSFRKSSLKRLSTGLHRRPLRSASVKDLMPLGSLWRRICVASMPESTRKMSQRKLRLWSLKSSAFRPVSLRRMKSKNRLGGSRQLT